MITVKVLTAAATGKAVPGEIVLLGETCTRETTDASCGCGRLFLGLSSGQPTTIAVVEDLALDLDDLTAAVTQRLTDDGFDMAEDAVRVLARELAEEIAAEAAEWALGTALRRTQPDDELAQA
jgi:hypothetical protein